MDLQVRDSLLKAFGYAPIEEDGERWCVFRDNLIVIHPNRRPRVYRRGCHGDYYEFEPVP